MKIEQGAPCGMNKSPTGTPIDTELTQARSGFVLEDTRRDLIAMREKYGADTPIGHRCSNLIGQIENYEHVMGHDRRKEIDRLIMRSIKELAELTK